MANNARRNDEQLGRSEQIEILLEEYRTLNSLLLFRLSAMDRRLPVSVAFVAAAVASMSALPPDAQIAALLLTPVSLLWLVRSTVQHARAKEDHLRRIDEIERAVNSLAGATLLAFQSQHPSRRDVPSGRTGGVTVFAVTSGCTAMLGLCLFRLLNSPGPVPPWLYVAYVCGVALDVVMSQAGLSRYRYQKKVELLKSR